ncbi:MAG: hypothetical protein KUG77_10140 [Nannocystaceae bacterium]|nr:hypothetical protein [Nannocystaceae bacterium]
MRASLVRPRRRVDLQPSGSLAVTFGVRTVLRPLCLGGGILVVSAAGALACELPELPSGGEKSGDATRPEAASFAIPGAPLVVDAWVDSKVEGEEGSVLVLPPGFKGVGDALNISLAPGMSLEALFEAMTAEYPPAGQEGFIRLDDERLQVRTIEHRLEAEGLLLVDDIKFEGRWHPGNRTVGIVVDGRVYTCGAGHSPLEFAEVGLEFCKTLRATP